MAINEFANCKELQYLNSIYFERTQFQPIVKLVSHDIVVQSLDVLHFLFLSAKKVERNQMNFRKFFYKSFFTDLVDFYEIFLYKFVQPDAQYTFAIN